jgi:quercetin dioxygenase-like cupin family protein
VEIRRFGPGHRRPEGPPGTQGLTGQVIHSDERGVVTELAFSRRGFIAPHSNPNLTLFIVISGGGFVQVGDERVPVNHGEAVVWPPLVDHGAYTDGVEMRAVVVELPEKATPTGDILDGVARPLIADGAPSDGPGAGGDRAPAPAPVPSRADGSLAERPARREEYDATEGEPW